MIDSFIFTGLGFVAGKHKLTNKEIKKHIKSGLLQGFNEDRILKSENYQEAVKTNPKLNPFDYMVKGKMGFETRYNVVPFPPAVPSYKNAENSLDLVVKAIQKALDDSGLSGNQIDAWFVGTATPHQYAPGIAEFAKAYFTDQSNTNPTYSLTSACVGFNINLQNAIAFLKSNPLAKHVVIGHAEVMSRLLTNERDFVPFSTFGDSAAAVILSRIETSKKYGVISIFNAEDTRMLDFLGANKKGNLYMDARRVKSRAVPNMIYSANTLLEKSGWKTEDIDWFIPHQTGNAIVGEVQQKLGIEFNKMLQDIQYNYGNLSGASVPASLSLLIDSKKSMPDQKILTTVAGLGGEFGGFTYILPENKHKYKKDPELKEKSILITGASGGIGSKIAMAAASEGANLILHYNSNDIKAQELKSQIESTYSVSVSLWKADLSNKSSIDEFAKKIKNNYNSINYLINTHAITGGLGKASLVSNEEFIKVANANYLSIKNLCQALKPHISESILITGSIGEDAQFPGSASYVAAKRALRGFAVNFASELYRDRVACVYYLPGLVNDGMVSKLESPQIKDSMMMISQEELLEVDNIAMRMLKSVYRMKIADVRITYESKLKVIKDGYLKY
ncbi:MAG: SDR family NAD(P)-dependent oxidoreductase [Bacteroidales bacterium]|nr:SDR family NAD(P)-dependent oxidoreductase [Bacteroidales bacterium]